MPSKYVSLSFCKEKFGNSTFLEQDSPGQTRAVSVPASNHIESLPTGQVYGIFLICFNLRVKWQFY